MKLVPELDPPPIEPCRRRDAGHADRRLDAALARMEAAKAALGDLAADPEAPGAVLLQAARRAAGALLPEASGDEAPTQPM